MFSYFNKSERIALLFLGVTLLIGGIISLFDYLNPTTIEEFRIVHGALAAPDSVRSDSSTISQPSHRKIGRSVAPDTSAKLDLNTASIDELQRLPKIGSKMAQRIVEFRRQYGPFRKLDDLQQVKGIGEKTLQILKPYIKISLPDSLK
jgi:competence ComEA-like helix-hairpin-helix protein